MASSNDPFRTPQSTTPAFESGYLSVSDQFVYRRCISYGLFNLPTFVPSFSVFFRSYVFSPPTSFNVRSNPMRIRWLRRIPQHPRPLPAQWMRLTGVYIPLLALLRISHTVMMTPFPVGRKRTLLVGASGSYVFPPP